MKPNGYVILDYSMIRHARTNGIPKTQTLTHSHMHIKYQSHIIVACSFRLRHVIKYYGEGWFNLFKYLVLIKHELECLHHSMIAFVSASRVNL